ncbi:MAG: pilus assembly protein TadG-related protein [Hyphomicrobium sp.]|nr:pilus assembly protein TadG-related protein [Hyphomicrobium sp.]
MFKSHLLSSTSAFVRDKRGNIAVIFALMSIPMLGMIGAAVDFSRAIHLQYKMQQMADSTALTGIRTYKTTGDAETAEQKMVTHVEAALREAGMIRAQELADLGAASIEQQIVYVDGLNIDESNSSAKPVLTSKIYTPFLGIGKIIDTDWPDVIDVSTKSEAMASASAESGTKALELSLMLDVSGSMAGQKLTDMKAAAADFLDIVLPDGQNISNRRVGIVPFSDRVNVGQYASAAMGLPASMQVQSGETITNVFSQTLFGWQTLNTCASRVRSVTAYEDYSNSQARAHCQANFQTQRSGNTTYYRTPVVVVNTTPNYVTRYLRPCVTERTGYDTYSEAAPGSGRYAGWHSPTQSQESQYNTGGTCSYTYPAIRALSNDKNAIKTHISAFSTYSGTAGHVGTAWSWYMLSPSWNGFWGSGVADVAPYSDTETIKAAVLMTDGEYNSNIASTSASQQALQICSRMKAAGIIVYTIGFDMSTNTADPARQTLQQCASPDKYYFPYDGTQLRAAFQQIGSQLVATTHTNSEDVEIVIQE